MGCRRATFVKVLLALSVTTQAALNDNVSLPGALALGLQQQIATSWRADAGWAPTTEVVHWRANETALVLIDLLLLLALLPLRSRMMESEKRLDDDAEGRALGSFLAFGVL